MPATTAESRTPPGTSSTQVAQPDVRRRLRHRHRPPSCPSTTPSSPPWPPARYSGATGGPSGGRQRHARRGHRRLLHRAAGARRVGRGRGRDPPEPRIWSDADRQAGRPARCRPSRRSVRGRTAAGSRRSCSPASAGARPAPNCSSPRLDPTAQVEPLEPPHLLVTLVDLSRPVDDLVVVGLTNRPELAARQAQVQATLTLLPPGAGCGRWSRAVVRGCVHTGRGTLAVGRVRRRLNSTVGDFGCRGDIDVQLLWQLDNLGLGNRARVQAAAGGESPGGDRTVPRPRPCRRGGGAGVRPG